MSRSALSTVEKLAEAIRIPTISYTDISRREDAPLDAWERFLSEAFPAVHGELEKEKLGPAAILFRWAGRDPALEPGALLAHFDVVPPGNPEEWRYPPFSGAIAEGYVWGRGAIDDKLSHIAILDAVEELLKAGYRPERTIYLCFGGDEEIGGAEGAGRIVDRLLRRGERLAWVLDEGGAVVEGALPGLGGAAALVGIAEKGHLNIRITARREGGHASTPPGETAVSELAVAIRRVVAKPFPRRLTPTVQAFLTSVARELPFYKRLLLSLRPLTNSIILAFLAKHPQTRALVRTTQAVTFIEGGNAENMLPEEASAVINIRLLHGETIDGALEHVRKAVANPGLAVALHGKWGNNGAVEASPTDHPLLSLLQETVEGVFEEPKVHPYLMTGSTDSARYTAVTRNIFRFVPMLLDNRELRRVHNADERVSLENIERARRFYVAFIEGGAGS